MKNRFFIAIIIIFPNVLCAQNNADSIKFEIIKETINFYFTDPNPVLNVPKDKIGLMVICKYRDYECVEKISKDIRGATNKVTTWKMLDVVSKKEVENFKNTILEDVTNEQQNKSYRKNLASYLPYVKTLETLVASYDSNSQQEALITDNFQADNLEGLQQSHEPMENTLPLIALIVSCVAVLLSGFVLYRKPHKLENQEGWKDDVAKLKNELHKVKQNSRKFLTKESLVPLEEGLSRLNGRIIELESNHKTPEITQENRIDIPLTIDLPDKPLVSFAKFRDLENGFSSSILSSVQNGEQTYQLEITGDSALYGVSDNIKAQKYALSNYEYLSDACDFINQAELGSQIYTVEKGWLTKSAGNWIIQSKALIEFR